MKSKRFRAEVVKDDATSGCGIRLPFEPKGVFGKARMPVVAKLGGHEYRTTTFTMNGEYWIPLSKANRAAASVEPGDSVTVTLLADEAPRVVEVPEDLAARLREEPAARARWEKLSYSHQREHAAAIEEAKKPETRARRIEKAIEMLKGS